MFDGIGTTSRFLASEYGCQVVSVDLSARMVARQALCGWTAMLHELEDQVAAFFEFDVTIGSCVADALCAAW